MPFSLARLFDLVFPCLALGSGNRRFSGAATAAGGSCWVPSELRLSMYREFAASAESTCLNPREAVFMLEFEFSRPFAFAVCVEVADGVVPVAVVSPRGVSPVDPISWSELRFRMPAWPGVLNRVDESGVRMPRERPGPKGESGAGRERPSRSFAFCGPWSMAGDKGPDRNELIHVEFGVDWFGSRDCGDEMDDTGGSRCLLPPGVAIYCGMAEACRVLDASFFSRSLKSCSNGFGSSSSERQGAGRA